MAQLTEKELTAINEQLEQEKVLISKLKDYSSKCNDSELKGKYEDMAAQHQRHIDTLLKTLN